MHGMGGEGDRGRTKKDLGEDLRMKMRVWNARSIQYMLNGFTVKSEWFRRQEKECFGT